MEDNLWWKTAFDGRQPLMEYNLWWETILDGRQPLMEDNIWWKTTFDGRQHLMEDDHCWKMTFDGRLSLMKDYFWLNTNFDGSWPFDGLHIFVLKSWCKNTNKTMFWGFETIGINLDDLTFHLLINLLTCWISFWYVDLTFDLLSTKQKHLLWKNNSILNSTWAWQNISHSLF